MCKVAGVAGITDSNRTAIWDFMKELGAWMTLGNNHGLGYAAFDKEYNIFGEKWLYNKEAFVDPIKRNTKHIKDYLYFGDKVKRHDVKSIILHTRMATCEKNIHNTHPFVDNFDKPKFALIHNGVISNHYKFKKIHSTCDSEVILHKYIEYNCNNDLKLVSNINSDLKGWYTCFVLGKNKNDKPIMDIFTNTGMLHSAYIIELKARVYSTSLDDIINSCEFFGYHVKDMYKLLSNSIRRIDINTGEIVFKDTFKDKYIDSDNNYSDSFYESLWEKWLNQTNEKDIK